MSTTPPQKTSLYDSQSVDVDSDVQSSPYDDSSLGASNISTIGDWGNRWGGWLKSAGDFVTSKGQEFIETVSPDIQEFASTIKTDTSNWVREHTLDLTSFARGDEVEGGDITDKENNLPSPTSPEEGSKVPSSYVESGRPDGGCLTSGDPSRLSVNTRSSAGCSTDGQSLAKTDLLPNASAHFRSKYTQLRSDESTYLEDPKGSEELSKLIDSYSVEQYDVLEWIGDPVVVNMQKSLVPDKVSEEMFWKRFLFQIHLIHKEEAHLAELMQRMKDTKDDDEEPFSWEEDEVLADDSEEAGGNTDSQGSFPSKEIASSEIPCKIVGARAGDECKAEENDSKETDGGSQESAAGVQSGVASPVCSDAKESSSV